MKVETWADAFGVWRASVPLTDSPRRDANVARKAIREELAVRTNLDPKAFGVTRERVTLHGTAIYVEKWKGL